MRRAIYQIQQLDGAQYEPLRTEDDFPTMGAALERMYCLAENLGWRGMRVVEIVAAGNWCAERCVVWQGPAST